ncbi:hypothetical protein [Mesorhizobium sp. RIZ17]
MAIRLGGFAVARLGGFAVARLGGFAVAIRPELRRNGALPAKVLTGCSP